MQYLWRIVPNQFIEMLFVFFIGKAEQESNLLKIYNLLSLPFPFLLASQVSSVARTPSRASRASRAVTDWPSHGAASLHSAACSEYRPTTASTRKTTPLPCMATSPRAPSKTMWGSAQTSARINPSSQRRHWQDTRVRMMSRGRSLNILILINNKGIHDYFWSACICCVCMLSVVFKSLRSCLFKFTFVRYGRNPVKGKKNKPQVKASQVFFTSLNSSVQTKPDTK